MKILLEEKVIKETIRLVESHNLATDERRYNVEIYFHDFLRWDFSFTELKPAQLIYIKELMEMKKYQ